MEKQRKRPESESCRRLLKKLFVPAVFFTVLFLIGVQQGFSQTLTNVMIRELRINPVQGQQFAVNTDIKFEVIIPYTLPGQIDISMPQEKENVSFKTLRKVEAAEGGGGTKIELWFSFSKTGTYQLSPLELKIKNSRKQISFLPVKIGINPKEQDPLCVIVTDSGRNKNISVTAGQTIRFRVCLQYAIQIVQFNWEIPKDSIFTQGKVYEFTEIKQREKIVSDDLIPISDFEWTPLTAGEMNFPAFNIQAIAYNGDKVNVRMPQIKVNVAKARDKNTDGVSTVFAQAFEADDEAEQSMQIINVSQEEARELARLRSRERHSFAGRARKQRIEYEKQYRLPYNQKEFKVMWIYVCVVIVTALIALLIYCLIKKQNGQGLVCGIALIGMLCLLIYCAVCAGKKYGVSAGGEIFSIPEESASIKSELPAGNRVQLLDKSGTWYHLRFGETEGWTQKETVFEIN